ncbi:MAG: hypothetical protein J6X33_05020 [Clostridiales bacterium]|nr:hypothetical protein [Clostridiales bacterium]
MRELVSYSCTSCGGALIVERDHKVFECPFCGAAFDLVSLHRKELIEDAKTNMMNMEFKAAKEKFESILSSDPRDLEALRDIVLCDGKLRSIESVRKIEHMQNCELTAMKNSCEDAKLRAAEEDNPYFDKLSRLIDLAGQYFESSKEKAMISYESTTGMKTDTSESQAVLISMFILILHAIFGTLFVAYTVGITAGLFNFLFSIILVIAVRLFEKHIIKRLRDNKIHDVVSRLHMKEDDIDIERAKMTEEYKNLCEELEALEPAAGDIPIPVFKPMTAAGEEA